jgi:hypothetical protein
MKTSRVFVLIALTFSIGFVAARWSAAQSGDQAPSKCPMMCGKNQALDRMNALVSYLETNKQTNALKLFNEFLNASIALEHSADIGMMLHILMGLHEGRTNDAMELLEGQLDTDIIFFAASYKELPQTQRESLDLHSLTEAHWYRSKFPFKHRYHDVDDSVARAFELLDKKSAN